MGKPYNRNVSVLDNFPFGPKLNFFDDFESSLNWDSYGTGTEVVELSTETVFMGSKALKIQTQTTSPTQGDYVIVHKKAPLKNLSIQHLALVITHSDDEFAIYFDISIYVYDGTTRTIYGVRLDIVNGKIFCYDYTDAFVEVTTDMPRVSPEAPTNFDLSFNPSSKEYLSLKLNTFSIDLSSFTPYQDAANNSPYGHIFLENTLAASGLDYKPVYVDMVSFFSD